jgi:hypothetical protein
MIIFASYAVDTKVGVVKPPKGELIVGARMYAK